LRYGIAATAGRSGRQEGRLDPALAGESPGIVASIDPGTSVHAGSALRGNRVIRLAALGASAPIHPRAPIHQSAALRYPATLSTGVGRGCGHGP
jgi:hypothetical protein